VVTESRLSVGAFLEDAMVDFMFIWQPELDRCAGAGALSFAAGGGAGVVWPVLPGLSQPGEA
jgi:hypothetical protein